jgi:hypothetical protein
MRKELGETVSTFTGGWNLEAIIRECAPDTCIDAITVVYQAVKSNGYPSAAVAFLRFISRAIKEENLAYQVDEEGGVHPLVDQAFDEIRASAITGLDKPKYNAVRKAFEDAYGHLDRPADTKAAVRSMFESIEIIAKLMDESVTRLTESTVKKKLLPSISYPSLSGRPCCGRYGSKGDSRASRLG